MLALDAMMAVVWAPRCAACDDALDAPCPQSRLPELLAPDTRHRSSRLPPLRRSGGSGRRGRGAAVHRLPENRRSADGAPGRRGARRHATGHHPRLQVRRAAVARTASRAAHAGGRRRLAARPRHRRPGAAPYATAMAAGIQSGGRPRVAPRGTRRACTSPHAPHRPPGRAVARGAAGSARRRVRTGAPERLAPGRRRGPWPLRGARRRRDHDRCDGGSLRGGTPQRRGAQRAGAQRSSGSRGSIAAAISAATTSGACSASTRTQSGWAA